MSKYRKIRFWSSAAMVVLVAVICLALALTDKDEKPQETASPVSSETGAHAAASPAPSETGAPEATPPSPSGTASPEGETRRYAYLNLEIELTNVLSDRTETMLDDGGGVWAYTVITLSPGARLSVIRADMSAPAYAEDGLPHPQWGILLNPEDPASRIPITDDLEPLAVTPEMRGIYSLEASLYVFRFEFSGQ